MPGFGHDSFGDSPFGQADWTTQVLEGRVPAVARAQDEEADNLFMRLIGLPREGFDFLRDKIEDLFALRHPLLVPSRYSTTEEVEVVSAEVVTDDETWGEYVTLICTDSPQDIGAGWLIDNEELRQVVLRVFKEEKRIDIRGRVAPTVGDLTFHAPEQLTVMYQDFGLVADRYLGDAIMRGELDTAPVWLGLKGSEDGYVNRGRTAGFDVTVYPLWVIDMDLWGGYVEVADTFTWDGHTLTTIAPRWPLFDEIACDAIPLDEFGEDEIDFAYTISDIEIDDGIGGTIPDPDTTYPVGTEYLLYFAEPDVWEVGDLGRWVVVDARGTVFAIEEKIDADTFVVSGAIPPVVGACTIRYECGLLETPEWSKTHYLKLVIVPTEELLEQFPGDSGDAIARLILREEEVKPAHVEFAAIVEQTSSTTNMSPVAVSGTQREVIDFVLAGTQLLDYIPADFIPLDTPDQHSVTDEG